MMNNIKFIVLTVMSLAVFASCNQKQAKESPAQKVEVKTVQPEYLLNDSIKKLIANNIVEYNTQAGSKYTLTNRVLGDVNFQQVEINFKREQSEIISNISYASIIPNKNMNVEYNKMLTSLKHKYGEPVKESQSISVDKTAKFTWALWDRDFYAISLYATVPIYEEKGSLIVVFTIPKDINLFSTFFK